jgi:hypothetical protein
MIEYGMNIEIFGLILTIFFGLISVVGIIITIIALNKPKLKYYQIDPSKLFSDKIDELDKIKIQYRSKKIEDKLLFLQVLINNEGNCDIDASAIYEPLNIKYEEPYKLLDAYIEKKEEKINLELVLENNSITINWDLLKKKEYFIINVVLNYQSEDSIKYSNKNLREKNTTLRYRIKDIDKIHKESYTKLITNKDKLILITLLSFLFINLLSLAYNELELNENYRKQKILYQQILENGENINKLNGSLLEVNRKYYKKALTVYCKTV